jgi:hypothetical protein
MINHHFTTLFCVLIICGCSKIEDKIVDISGIVFLIFIFFFAMKPVIASIVTSKNYKFYYDKYVRKFFNKINYFIIPLYIFSVFFILYGIISIILDDGTDKISIFVGILMYLFAGELKKLKLAISIESQKKIYEKINLIIVFMVAFLSLLFLGSKMFTL